jgi:hypothetical protein
MVSHAPSGTFTVRSTPSVRLHQPGIAESTMSRLLEKRSPLRCRAFDRLGEKFFDVTPAFGSIGFYWARSPKRTTNSIALPDAV